MNTNGKRRIAYIDFLKFIGLSGIISAHVSSPDVIMMIRNFDVVLMLLLSSMLAARSYDKYISTQNPIKKYYISRIKRLVVPTWIFLSFYFFVHFIMGDKVSIRYIFASFAMTRYGIGYVWIILIYLYCALLVPVYKKMTNSNIKLIFICIVIVLYLFYEIAYLYHLGTDNKIIMTTFYYIIPYGIVGLIGYSYTRISQHNKWALLISSSIIFIIYCSYYLTKLGSFQSVQMAKYPPRLYYLSYGIMCSFALMLFCENKNFKIYTNRIVHYISQHSMWIYLWHILILEAYDYVRLPNHWYIKYLTVYTGTVIMVIIINQGLNLVEKKHKYKIIAYLRG